MDTLVKCLVCDSSFDELTTSREDHRKLDETFQKYFCVESWDGIKSEFKRRISDSSSRKSKSKTDKSNNSSDMILRLPFCGECTNVMCQLSSLHENLLKIQTQIDQIVSNTNDKIIQTEKQHGLEDEQELCKNVLPTIIRSNIFQSHTQQKASFHNVQEKGKVTKIPILMSTASQTDVIKIMIRADINPEERRKAQEAKWKLLQQQTEMGASNAVNLNVDIKLNSDNNSCSQNSSSSFIPEQELAINFDGGDAGKDGNVNVSGLNSEIQVINNNYSIGQNKYERPRKSEKKIIPESKKRRKPQKVGDGEFSYNGILFNQVDGDDKFQCRECNRILKNRKSTIAHIRFEHCTGDFQCPKCLKYFLSQNIVKSHSCEKRQKERPLSNIIEIEPQKFTLNSFPFQVDGDIWTCGTCDSHTSNKKTMIDHVKLKHAGLYHECEVCEKRFLYKASLESHLPAHSEELSFLCPHCGKLFRTQGNMQTHISIVHTKKSTKKMNQPGCTLCNIKKFNSLWAYYNHKRTIHYGRQSSKPVQIQEFQLD